MAKGIRAVVVQFNPREIVEKKLAEFDAAELEKMIKEISNDQLGYITLLGGILGCIAGVFIQYPVYSLLIGGSLVAVLLLADQTIVSLRARRQHVVTVGKLSSTQEA